MNWRDCTTKSAPKDKDAMVEYANLKIDECTAQLMEEGLI